MKTIAQRVDELIKEGDQVHCLIIGCMGPILEVFNGSFIVSFPHRRGIYKRGSLHLNDKLNSPKLRLYHNKEKNRYEVVHRKKYIEKMTRGKTNVGAGLAKALLLHS